VKNKFNLFGTQSGKLCAIALLAVIAFSMAACDSGFGGDSGTDPSLNGTWVNEDGVNFTFNNGNWEFAYIGEPVYKGTFTTNGSILTVTTTHMMGGWHYDLDRRYDLVSGKWYSMAELRAFGVTRDELDHIFPFVTCPYSISGNVLYMTFDGETEALYKR